ncbi:MAG: D-alanyl-D-alanine carboxypeptidase [Clostridia bacterium]|nr:D-alanyl-D-alanine carboxypeptidase [Clostridia bacterium]
MSENFNNRGYEDYFKTLEKQIKSENKPERKPVFDQEIKETVPKKRGVYKVVRLRKSVIAVMVALVVLITGISVIAVSGSKEEPSSEDNSKASVETKEEKETTISYTFTDETVEIPATNDAKTAIIIDKSTNKVIAARNPHAKAYPASTTKIMTLLVAAENIKDYNDTFTMTTAITDPLFVEGASVAGFLNKEVINMTDMLYGLILPSGADAAVGLAVKIAGSEEAFVKMMNEKAKELKLQNTHFANVTGLHDENNYTSAYDLAIILDAAIQNQICREILSTPRYNTAATEKHPEGISFVATLFTYLKGDEPETAFIHGGKTGFVNASGYCIASFGTSNDSLKDYIVVTLGNSMRKVAFDGQIDLYKEFAK